MPWGAQPQVPEPDQDKGGWDEVAEVGVMLLVALALLPIAAISAIAAVAYRRAGLRAWTYWALAILTAGIGLAVVGWPAWAADYERGYGVLSGHAIDVLLWLPVAVPVGCIGGLGLGRTWRYLAKRSRHQWSVLPVPEGRARWFRRDTSPDYRRDRNLPWEGRGLRPGVLDGPNKAAEKVAADAPLPGRFTLGYAILPVNRANRRNPPRRLINAEYHLLVVAQPGAGKTYSLVIPNVLEWCGTLVVTTISSPKMTSWPTPTRCEAVWAGAPGYSTRAAKAVTTSPAGTLCEGRRNPGTRPERWPRPSPPGRVGEQRTGIPPGDSSRSRRRTCWPPISGQRPWPTSR